MNTLIVADLEINIRKAVEKFPFLFKKADGLEPMVSILRCILDENTSDVKRRKPYFNDTFLYLYARTNDKGEADLADLEEIYHTLLQFFGYKKSSKPSTYSIRYEKELAEIAANFWKNIPQEYQNKPFFWLNAPLLTLTYRYKGQCNLQFERKLLTTQFPKAMLCVTCFEADSK